MVQGAAQEFEGKVRIIPDFPKEGIQFLDLTTLFNDAESFRQIIDIFADHYKDNGISQIVGIEARGFVVASALAYRLGCGVTLIRKPGKLPAETVSESYSLEYGTNEIHIHKDAFKPGEKILMIDDLLATGGTMKAGIKLVEKLGAKVAGVAFIAELSFLNGREKFSEHPVFSLFMRS